MRTVAIISAILAGFGFLAFAIMQIADHVVCVKDGKTIACHVDRLAFEGVAL